MPIRKGPFYVVGAPKRQIEDGKMVLAPSELLRSEWPNQHAHGVGVALGLS